MRVYRIERHKYLPEVLSGRGAALSEGNRWNSLHTLMVYCSESRSLVLLEVLAHVDLYTELPTDRMLVEIEIPDGMTVQHLPTELLPDGWNTFPSGEGTQRIGDDFIRKSDHLLMQVPSSLVEGEYNFLINPLHPKAKEIRIISAVQIKPERWRK